MQRAAWQDSSANALGDLRPSVAQRPSSCCQWPRNTRYQAGATLTWAGLPPAGSHQLAAGALTRSPRRRAIATNSALQGRAREPFAVDDELEFGLLQHRQVGGLRSLEDLSDVDTRLTKRVRISNLA